MGRKTARDGANDRQWFATHPAATERVRRRVPGEYGARDTEAAAYTHVLVVQMFAGARARIGLHIYQEDHGPLTQLVHIPTGERWPVERDGTVVRSAQGREAWEALAPPDIRTMIRTGRHVAPR